MRYRELKNKQQKEINDFPFIFAFSNKQLEENMLKLGLNKDDTGKLYSLGSGTFIRKEDSKKMDEMFDRHNEELKAAINEDTIGDNFIYDMFVYELNNHEYCITYDIDDTLKALNLTIDDIKNDERLKYGLSKAINYIKGNLD